MHEADVHLAGMEVDSAVPRPISSDATKKIRGLKSEYQDPLDEGLGLRHSRRGEPTGLCCSQNTMDQTSPAPASQPDTPKSPATSLPARLMNVFAAPGEVFAEIRAAPVSAANWLVPALLIIVVGWTAAWLIFSQESFLHQVTEIADKAIEKQIEKTHVGKEQAEAMRQMAQKWSGLNRSEERRVGKE